MNLKEAKTHQQILKRDSLLREMQEGLNIRLPNEPKWEKAAERVQRKLVKNWKASKKWGR